MTTGCVDVIVVTIGPCVEGLEYVTIDVTWVTTVVGTSDDDAGMKDVEGSAVTTDVEGARVVVVDAKLEAVVGVALASLVVDIGVDAVVVEVASAAVEVVTDYLLGPREDESTTVSIPALMVTRHRAPCIAQTTMNSSWLMLT